MSYKYFTCFLALLFTGAAYAQRFDTTVKMNDEGFRVMASNKDFDNNNVTVEGIKLSLDNSRQIDFAVKGRVSKAAVDDLTGDGDPDLIVCVYGGTNNLIGNVIGISYAKAEKTLKPIIFPDIYSDPKIRDGYRGHDAFSLVVGTLLRKFPVYLQGDTDDKPTGGIRTVQYSVAPGEQGRLSFKVLRFFDTRPGE
ncbi:MAG TPA: hypothetical protein VHB48_18620 [Chitinophagaceae bacterium]|nr:hypothetical protein [Chitinophagaceae bacterium]